MLLVTNNHTILLNLNKQRINFFSFLICVVLLEAIIDRKFIKRSRRTTSIFICLHCSFPMCAQENVHLVRRKKFATRALKENEKKR